MKIILFLLANLFLVNSLALTNKIGTSHQNKIDSVDIPDEETDYDDDGNKFDNVDIDEETDDDCDDGIVVPEKKTEPNVDNGVLPEITEFINNTKIKIKLNNVTLNNKQFSEITKNDLNEIRKELKGIVNEIYIDTVFEIDKVKQECKINSIHLLLYMKKCNR